MCVSINTKRLGTLKQVGKVKVDDVVASDDIRVCVTHKM
jgi:hypothetical protein